MSDVNQIHTGLPPPLRNPGSAPVMQCNGTWRRVNFNSTSLTSIQRWFNVETLKITPCSAQRTDRAHRNPFIAWSCVSRQRDTTSSEWKLCRFDEMEFNYFESLLISLFVINMLENWYFCANQHIKRLKKLSLKPYLLNEQMKMLQRYLHATPRSYTKQIYIGPSLDHYKQKHFDNYHEIYVLLDVALSRPSHVIEIVKPATNTSRWSTVGLILGQH